MRKFAPFIFIIAVWFIFAHPYFLKGLVPYASTYQVNFFSPWSHYEKFWGPVKNNAMPDVHTQIFPWKKFTIDTYKSGQIPLWNPNNFAGNPHLANFQSAVLSPFNLLFFLFPFVDAWSILVLLAPLLAALFTYLLMRAFKVSQAGSLISSISFMFCGFIVVWMAYGTLAYAILYLPLALFAIEKFFQTEQKRFLILLTVSIALALFSGHFQTSIYFAIFTFSFLLFEMSRKKRLGFPLVLSFAAGLIVSIPQLLPSIQLYLQSVRSEIFIQGGGIPFFYLVTIFSPDFFGNPVTRNDWFGFYAEWASFVGIIPLSLALYTIGKGIKKETLFFLIAALITLLLAIDSPIQQLIGILKIPVLSTSNPSRIIVLLSFSLAVLSGLGFDNLIKERRYKKLAVLASAIATVFAFVWIVILFTNVYPQDWLIVAKRNAILPTILFVGGVLAIILSLKNKQLLLIVSCYLLVATSFDSLRFAQKWMPFDPKHLVYPNTPVVDAIRSNIGFGRIFGNLGDAVISSYYGFPTLDGYDPLYIARYGEFIRAASRGEFLKGERSVVKLDRTGKYTDRVLDLLGVSLIFNPTADTNQGWAYPVWRDKIRNVLIYQDDKFQLYQNTQALGRATLFYSFEVLKNDEEMLKRFYSDDFNFRKTVLLDEEPLLSISKEGSGSASIVSYSPNKVEIEATTTTPALLFLSDNYYTGWKALVNGKTAKIYRADYIFRAVEVPAGKSAVVFTYKTIL